MSATLGQAALFGGLGALAGVVGALVGRAMRPGDAAQSAIQHFAAGVVLAGAAIELLPEAIGRAARRRWSAGSRRVGWRWRG